MKTSRLDIPDVVLLEPRVFEDRRGFFMETWTARGFAEDVDGSVEFVQDNHSGSARGVLRGLHYQVEPHPQGKLVRVVAGAVFDVAVDIRRSSRTFRSWVGATLTSENRRQLWIPPGFAHGFYVLADGTEVLYKTTGYYSADCDRSIRWDDPDIAIAWPLDGAPAISDKDAAAPMLAQAEIFD
jgi:dTDP-4-dehydrorhamnose 3,5-epimerase